MKKLLTLLGVMPLMAEAQTTTEHWYDKIAIRGYIQARYNRLLETNELLKCEQCDRSWGEGGGIFLRRVRLIVSAQIHPRVYIYLQPDFASSVSTTSLHFGQLRDAYFDLGLTANNEFRVRIGQSKVPYGFEDMQSSQNRLPLDRSDAINSSHSNERDLGAFVYWAPTKIRKQFTHFVQDGLKGSGDYGVAGLGIYNGQGANRPESNNKNLHVVGRVAYPFQIGHQTIEPGVQAYTGKYTLTADQLSTGVKVATDRTYRDERVAASFILYPQPFGIQAEYNVGRGPQFNKTTDSIELTNLNGGYATICYMLSYKKMLFYPFVRLQYYRGGKKFETDARSYSVDEFEAGVEWQPFKAFELVAQYTISDRRFEDFRLQENQQKGGLLRLQAQINF